MKDAFLTVDSPSEGYTMDRGSKFHSFLFPVNDEAEAYGQVQMIKKTHPKAKHYCTAMRIGPEASIERSNDDGEPPGSAGKPIMGQLVKNDLTNVVLVVVRYFGGTKLGIPGLIDAYRSSAANAISNSQIIQKKVFVKVRIESSYELFPKLSNFFRQHQWPVFHEEFHHNAILIVGFPKSSVKEELMTALKIFSQLDLNNVEQYEQSLSLSVKILDETAIIGSVFY